MQVNMRREPRSVARKPYSVSWQDAHGFAHSQQVEGVDSSPGGIGFRCAQELPVGCVVYIQGDSRLEGFGVVRHCAPAGAEFIAGLELGEGAKASRAAASREVHDYYAFLQISPTAEPETIHRVYRFLASRFHPDNPETGDAERFLLLKRVYETLSNPELRAIYDASQESRSMQPMAAFETIDFLDGIEGEVNRRLAVLSILYQRRRINADHPHVSLAELESRMGFPREYLDFTTWYLKGKKLITREDNSDFALTALGVDYIETNYSTTPTLRRLLAGVADRGTPAAEAEKHDIAAEEAYRLRTADLQFQHAHLGRKPS